MRVTVTLDVTSPGPFNSSGHLASTVVAALRKQGVTIADWTVAASATARNEAKRSSLTAHEKAFKRDGRGKFTKGS